MTIAVQLSAPETTNDTGAVFNQRCFSKLAELHPAVRFIFIFDQEPKAGYKNLPNITVVVLGPVVKNNLIQHYWYHFKLSRLLNRQNVSLFISSTFTCSLKTKIPQCIWLNDTALFSTNGNNQTKKWLSRYIAKADSIITINPDIQAAVEKKYSNASGKLISLQFPSDENIAHLSYQQKEAIKTEYAGGQEYFLFDGTHASTSQTITVLKAFSLFKKWQKSAMKLLLMAPDESKKKLEQSLRTYKFREDVSLLTAVQPSALYGSAYAILFFSQESYIPFSIADTSAFGVPLILPNAPFYKAVFEQAAVYTEPTETAISQVMMQLYKDENLRNHLIGLCRQLAGNHSIENVAGKLWQGLLPDRV
jgi:glycosyltransferase involved in cell wall biosynthesis